MTVRTKTRPRVAAKKTNQEKAKKQPLDGVTYDRVAGVDCPACRMNLGRIPGGSVTNTLPWEDGIRVRYHTCRRCGARFKSVESE